MGEHPSPEKNFKKTLDKIHGAVLHSSHSKQHDTVYRPPRPERKNAMTNNEIIFETVRNTFTPAQLAELVQATYTAEQIAARRAAVTITVDEGSDESAENIFSAMLAADTFHTFAEWKRMGYSVKKGQHAALTCQLWKYTDKPGKAAREAAEADGKDAPETDPHFYMTKAHLFHALQVEKSKR